MFNIHENCYHQSQGNNFTLEKVLSDILKTCRETLIILKFLRFINLLIVFNSECFEDFVLWEANICNYYKVKKWGYSENN